MMLGGIEVVAPAVVVVVVYIGNACYFAIDLCLLICLLIHRDPRTVLAFSHSKPPISSLWSLFDITRYGE